MAVLQQEDEGWADLQYGGTAQSDIEASALSSFVDLKVDISERPML